MSSAPKTFHVFIRNTRFAYAIWNVPVAHITNPPSYCCCSQILPYLTLFGCFFCYDSIGFLFISSSFFGALNDTWSEQTTCVECEKCKWKTLKTTICAFAQIKWHATDIFCSLHTNYFHTAFYFRSIDPFICIFTCHLLRIYFKFFFLVPSNRLGANGSW